MGKEGQKPVGNRQWHRRGGKTRTKTDSWLLPIWVRPGALVIVSQSLIELLLEGTPPPPDGSTAPGTASFQGRIKDSESRSPSLVASAVNELPM